MIKNSNEPKGEKLNISELKQAIQSGNADAYIQKNVDKDTASKIKSVLNDKTQMEKIMNSKAAAELLKKFGGDK